MTPRLHVVLALGSNLGDRLGILQGCVDAIAGVPEVEVMAVSPVYETVPVGGPPQPDYLNAVLLARTSLPASTLLSRLHEVEGAFGRVRDVRFGPRTLDIDIIAYGSVVSSDPALILPHPRAHERAFVLAPWRDVDPDAVLPGRGRVADLLAAGGAGLAAGVRKTGAVLTLPANEHPEGWAPVPPRRLRGEDPPGESGEVER